jgi:hypothetical protein
MKSFGRWVGTWKRSLLRILERFECRDWVLARFLVRGLDMSEAGRFSAHFDR